MIAEVIRMTAIALADATLGVNAQIAALALDATAAGVTDARPPNVVSILNQADHNIEVREAQDENQYPLIIVGVNAPFLGPGQVWTSIQDTEGAVSCVYITRGGSAAANFLNTDYTLRAMKKAIHAYLTSVGRDIQRKRNSIAISNAKTMELTHAGGQAAGGEVAGVLKITYTVRDQTP